MMKKNKNQPTKLMEYFPSFNLRHQVLFLTLFLLYLIYSDYF
ncbi:hypothetical protein LEWO105114_01915 [Legionella worsleiensis]|nr:Uncharacterised protein [Legionella worsleiensis]